MSPRKLAEKDLVEVREELSEVVDHFLRDFDEENINNLFHELNIIQKILQQKKEQGKELKTLVDLYELTRSIFPQTKRLVQIILTSPIKSNEGERSLSMLRKLYSWLRVSMKSDRLDNLGRMVGHPERLSLITNEKILEVFVSKNQGRFNLVPVRAGPW